MKFRSLKSSFQRIIISLIIIFIGSGILTLIMGNNLFKEINSSLVSQSKVTNYFEKIEDIQQLLKNELANSSDESRVNCIDELDQLKQLVNEISEEIDHPQFIDLYYQTDAYQSAAIKFVELSAEETDLLASYQTAIHIGDLILERFLPLNSIKEQVLIDKNNQFSHTWRLILLTDIVLIAIISLIEMFVGLRFIKRVVTPIVKLTKKTELLAKGKFNLEKSKQLLSEHNNETRVLEKSFNKMAEIIQDQMRQLKNKILMDKELHRLEMENMQMQVSLVKAENIVTQSLVNPHFLFNCINTLAGLAYIEGAPKLQKSANLIARFLRGSLSRVGKDITLKEELEHLQQYVEIQQLRFEKRIAFSISCEPNCEQAIMPAMIVQPLVENSITHGVGTYIKNAFVNVCGKLYDEKTVIITVTDNGIGMSQEKISQILDESCKDFSSRENSFGLRSIIIRLKASMGESADLSFESDSGNTSAILKFPYKY